MILNDGSSVIETEESAIYSIQRSLNIITSFLLLTGQITITGVFVRPARFSLNLGGPLFGGRRIEGEGGWQTGSVIIDLIDVIIAILLITDEITLTAIAIGPSEFTVNASGPIFGFPKVIPSLPRIKDDFQFFHSVVSTHFHVPSELDNIFQRNDTIESYRYSDNKTV
jgi:hypothetical protein